MKISRGFLSGHHMEKSYVQMPSTNVFSSEFLSKATNFLHSVINLPKSADSAKMYHCFV